MGAQKKPIVSSVAKAALATQVHQYIQKNIPCDVCGGELVEADGFWLIEFSERSLTDGEVRVYSSKYILLKYNTRRKLVGANSLATKIFKGADCYLLFKKFMDRHFKV